MIPTGDDEAGGLSRRLLVRSKHFISVTLSPFPKMELRVVSRMDQEGYRKMGTPMGQD